METNKFLISTKGKNISRNNFKLLALMFQKEEYILIKIQHKLLKRAVSY